ncbi:type I-F CRISPR-associated protein Csy1 [Nitrosomonas sp. PY1]|uniref:type I-F CRISPR-associated protein Csy1 n=1 Tax=Nitrosomonas sp. PY1 TaxID=1803906 RepID=UPI001FC83113|nr:type I-F CRISPR-associated protein Csy1 [Nitrosomonas sp. PY1]GKS68080.1 type I-F CRISPR-associated protein Csy1 [Nitrosomonas sp. PY1]
MSQDINSFLEERKVNWLKARVKASMSDEEQENLVAEANEKFFPATWLPDAAKRAAWLSIVSHPGKFSHPSAKTTSIIAIGKPRHDGYLRSGNVEYELDVLGNAAAMDVYKFLSLTMEDGETVLQHLERDSPEIRTLLTMQTVSYESLKEGFMTIKQTDGENKTDQLVKQVYFPVDDAYHLLSLMTPSGLLTKLKAKIDTMRFSEKTQQAREHRKKNEHHEHGFEDLLELTVTAYGGTKPQNISVLNNQNAGLAYLLPSIPPNLHQRQIRLPTSNFFRNSLWPRQFQESFQTLDRLIKSGINNKPIRDGIHNTLKFLIDQVMQRVFQIRAIATGWSEAEHYRNLPLAQRIWLDDAKLEQRQNHDDWLKEVAAAFAKWLLDSYEYLHKDTQVKLSDDELLEVKKLISEALNSDKEFFK